MQPVCVQTRRRHEGAEPNKLTSGAGARPTAKCLKARVIGPAAAAVLRAPVPPRRRHH
ncbi:hypothetical protein JYU34_021571 [Plutella xylostella]|uniref:Uncharacterized protein n=1 Tax=Plutella xylostella TaxID=51655 RepID=A0ABQ7PTX0_PLUXY|nr:hypothetical protein JYU34_021571 [Plutella xylostella]